MQFKKNVIIAALLILLLIFAVLLLLFFLKFPGNKQQNYINNPGQVLNLKNSHNSTPENKKPDPNDFQYAIGKILTINPKQLVLQTDKDKVALSLAEGVKVFWVDQNNTLRALGIFDLKEGNSVLVTKYDLKTKSVKEIKLLI